MKKIVCFIIALLMLTVGALASDISVDELLDNAPDEVTNKISTPDEAGKLLDAEEIINFLTDNLLDSVKGNLKIIGCMIGVVIIMGIYEAMADSFSAGSRIGDFACVTLVALLVCNPLFVLIDEIRIAVEDTAHYVCLSVPVFAGLLTAQGNVTSATIFNLLLYNGASIIAQLFSSVAMPLCHGYVAIGLASQMGEMTALKNITSGIKATVNRVIVTVSMAFTGLLSLQNMLGRSGDALSKKALKIAVGSALPVGGSVLSDSVDAFWESLGLIKSAGGIIAVAAIFYLIAIPVIKALAASLCVRLCSLIASLVGSTRAVGMLTVVENAYSMMLTAAFAVLVIFVVSIGILLSTGGAV